MRAIWPFVTFTRSRLTSSGFYLFIRRFPAGRRVVACLDCSGKFGDAFARLGALRLGAAKLHECAHDPDLHGDRARAEDPREASPRPLRKRVVRVAPTPVAT